MTCNRQKTKGSAKDILWCRSASKLLNFKKSTVKDQLHTIMSKMEQGGALA